MREIKKYVCRRENTVQTATLMSDGRAFWRIEFIHGGEWDDEFEETLIKNNFVLEGQNDDLLY